MRLDHIAYRVFDKKKAAKFFVECFGYQIADKFEIKFDDGSKAKCLVLKPPEKVTIRMDWKHIVPTGINLAPFSYEYHLAPEIFISDGDVNSIVGKWVKDNGNGIHHIAYQVDSVEQTMKEWKEKGYAEFTTDEPLSCEGVTQVFTKPSELTGIIYEFIEREEEGFCKANVKELMNSTKNL